MNKKSKTLKILLIILAVIIVVAMVVMGGRSPSSQPRVGLVTTSPSTGVVTQGAGTIADATTSTNDELVTLLHNVSSLKLSRDVFSSPVFGALVDIGSSVPDDPNPGRPNPFLDIGNDTSVMTTSTPTDTTPVVTPDPIATFLNPIPTTPISQ